ncbi:MAG: excinuclease ABC subunit A [Candidatus Sungbacteria bacterium RIFCSPLOWO2_02_FULL_54_10]|uniref:UvrABC system protein A n=2 Tax=Candidatus Sungiibacteriota TaxID=1817917 RepID=A0A1G2L7C6_9BACT|nr:MAG: excinuclease ABC subunit A [Candidatus Sungbacteria bacterium RIFCSPHIGHO2_01_FULL_54_26]OHA03648.1 MAG: excinuclease ABC subunit A [Candidatus Sungbacteria bacterium RIFCSPHIGHO2_02_FULL_53_17]OHA06732.1 MAG: excinuclease ABC subunit A [Candidatus Sungbacteria bacterium RIFCSPLOWO2_01_FULL_54_21]OHA12248.1 MAG: excinuclease ABC subunit A [Candidatus Sungbacteria bacterium RIFCSPLOWO2_02_FULL_54_10]
MSHIRVRGARVHNLKNVDVDIPRNALVVITGLSGSGKSSLAFDTIYAEAERRFVESLSTYARQFLGVKDKPDVDSIEGLSPAISISQKSVSKNPRSTVGTITEIYDYLRILFSRIGKPHCPQCGKPVGRQTADQIVRAITALPMKREIAVLAPLIRSKKGEHKGVLEEIKRGGFLRVRWNGSLKTIDDALAASVDKQKKHSVEVVVDRFIPSKDIERSRIRDSVETALKIGKGILIVGQDGTRPQEDIRFPKNVQHRVLHTEEKSQDMLFSEHFACAECGINLPDIEPRTFSFNSPYGACPACTGLGSTLEVDPELVLPNKRLSIAEGAIRPWASASHRVGRQSWYWWILDDLASRHGFSLSAPVQTLSPQAVDLILYGENTEEQKSFEGVIPNLKRRWKETDSDFTRAEIEKYMLIKACPDCTGLRLRPEALSVKIGAENIATVTKRTVEDAAAFFMTLMSGKTLGAGEAKIAAPLAKEILKRLQFLRDVGLEYLTLSRESTTLSGGEAQRIQLATQIGSRLQGLIYILDEPSIGLHPRDHSRLIATIKELRDLGNTVILVEHDADTMRSADWIVDIGPGAGKHGGKVIFSGTPKDILKARTPTGDYLSGRKKVHLAMSTPQAKDTAIIVRGAREHNLKNIDISIPLKKFVCVSGISGSGKSTLVNDILAKSLLAKLHGAHTIPGAHTDITGIEHINKAVVVDQSPIGRTPRSNPATYTGAFGFIRTLFAATPEARVRGYTPGRFSFNVKGGRCEVCEGQGVKKIEMYFLPDVYVECEECRGLRYSREALDIEYNGKNIAEVLDLTIEEALEFFTAMPAIRQKFATLAEVGLGYMRVGQSAPTLSGGEAQRVKLAAELSRRDTGSTFYILDEPTTGLHFDDIAKLLKVLKALVEKGNTVLVIEHNLDVLKNSDWIIDLGPEGGDRGGMLVAEGTPEQIAKIKKSYTGQWLAKES